MKLPAELCNQFHPAHSGHIGACASAARALSTLLVLMNSWRRHFARKADKLAGVGQFRRRLGNFNFTTNGSCSKAPNGPFQTNVLLRANTETIGDADDLGSIRETGGSIRTMKKRKLTV